MGVMADIVVGIDGSVGSENALRWAVSEARLRSATVRAVLALTANSWITHIRPHEVAERSASTGPEDLPHAARQVLQETVHHVPLGDPPVPVVTIVAARPPVRALVDASQDAQMLVVGARGRSRMRRRVIGSVSGACMHEATAPVVVVHGRVNMHPDKRPVLVGVDGSQPSLDALRWAADEAALRGVTLRVVHIWTGMPELYSGFYPIELPPLEKVAQSVLDSSLQDGLGDRDDISVDATLIHGPTVRGLLDAAEFSQLLVVGARGHGGFAELLLGSTSQQCLTHAECPVAVITNAQRPPEPEVPGADHQTRT
jgi:nucleotide-binding universal stress UspA family protein